MKTPTVRDQFVKKTQKEKVTSDTPPVSLASMVEALRLSEEKYRTLVDHLNDGIFIIQNEKLQFINETFASIIGYSVQEVIGKKFQDFVAPAYLEAVIQRYHERQLGEENIPKDYEIQVVKKDKTLIDVLLSVGVIMYNGKVASMGIAKDITQRKKTEYNAKISELRYRRLFETAQDGILLIDFTTGMILDVNPFLIDMLGYSKADFLEKYLWEIGVFKDVAASKENFVTLQTKKYVRFEDLPLETKAGKKMDVEFVANAYHVDGTMIIQCNIRDITDRKKAEKELKEKEQLLRQVIDLVPHFIFAKDTDSKFILVNKAVADAYGSTPQKLLGKSDIDFSATPQQAKQFHEDDLAVIQGGIPKFISEEQIKDVHGNIRFLQTTKIPFSISHGYAKGVLGVSVDITEQKQLREKILEDKAKDEAILESIGDAVFACDKHGIIMLFNGMAERMSGISADAAIGHSYHDILHFVKESTGKPNNDFIVEAIIKKKITNMKNHTFLVRSDGSKIPVADSAAPISNENGEIIGCVVVFHDMTHEYQIDVAKTEFVSLASHQLRTPLTAINWYSEMLLSDGVEKMTQKQQHYLHETQNASKRMVALIDSLLNVSRLELGTFVVEPEQVSIEDIAKTCISDLLPLIKKRKVNFQETYDATMKTWNADPKLFSIILSNLLSNAVKYTPSEGNVHLTIQKSDGACVLMVSDTGIGIPKMQQDKIYTKLFRADNAKKIDPDGTGLGLYIIYTIVVNSGGTIDFTSSERGTTFTIRYPLTGMVKKTGTKQLV